MMDMMPMPDANRVYNLRECEGNNMMLKCPEATEIRILDGFFGRDDNTTCQVVGRTHSNMNCIVPKDRVLEKLRMGCEGKMSCMVPATIETFTSPCAVETSKYARATYTCVPTLHKVEVCSIQERSKVQLCCPDSKIIMTQNVFIGRSDAHTLCRSEYNSASNRTNCSGQNTLGYVQEMCDGEMSCEIDIAMLGEPCGMNNYKYLSVNYTCQECMNDYGNDALCDTWANQGFCYTNAGFMYSRCRKSCLGCGREMPPEDSTTDNCVNAMDDVQCEIWAAAGECNDNPTFMIANCRRTCMACGLLTDCIDRNTNCEQWASEGQCTTNPSYMLPMCRKSCFQCESIVPCRDRPEFAEDCPVWAEDGECDSNPGFMLPFCTKTCLGCQKSPMCTNKHKNEFDCLRWANTDDQCSLNPVWMHQNCWADCIGCLREPVCVNYHGNDAECDWWWYTGRAFTEPNFMMFNCLKSVTKCRPKDYVEMPKCRNHIGNDTQCTEFAAQGECLKNPIWMMKNCFKACTKCDMTPASMRVGGCMRSGQAYSAEYATNVVLPYTFMTQGSLVQFSGVFVNTERFRIGVWRKSGSSWVEIFGQNVTPKGNNTLEVIPVNGCVNVMPDDRIGFTKTTYGDYPFAYGTSMNWAPMNKVYVRPTTSGNFVGVPTKGSFAVDAVVSAKRC
jgi:hypothetical protein